MFIKAEIGLVAAALFTTITAAPAQDSNLLVRKVDPCTVEEKVVALHEKYGTGILPKKVEDCIVTQRRFSHGFAGQMMKLMRFSRPNFPERLLQLL